MSDGILVGVSGLSSKLAEEACLLFAQTRESWNASNGGILGNRELLAGFTQKLTEFFRQIGIPEADFLPLQELNIALFDLAKGARNPLFKLAERGRAPEGWKSDQRRIWASALVQWLRPLPVREAYALIAAEFSRAGHRGHNGKVITSNTVRRWCEIVREGGERRPEETLALVKATKWKAKEAQHGVTPEPATFVRHIAVGLLGQRTR